MMDIDNFVTIELSKNNLDTYLVRTSIKKAIEETLPILSGKILDIGCGKMPYKKMMLQNSNLKDYIGLDIETARVYEVDVKPDFTWNGITMPFENETFDCAFGTEVLEHCPYPEIVLKEVFRVLKPGGVFFLTVPFLWNLHEVPHDEYRYTPFSLQKHLTNSGFSNIKLKAMGGWHASMAQMLGLWVKRAPMGVSSRKLLTTILKPVIKYLIKKDKNYPTTFKEKQMITGLYGTAERN
jgi:SAM-dependent methyltransferase